MTKDRAAELVQAAAQWDSQDGYDLFEHFLSFFNIHHSNKNKVNEFAVKCGYGVVMSLEPLMDFYDAHTGAWRAGMYPAMPEEELEDLEHVA